MDEGWLTSLDEGWLAPMDEGWLTPMDEGQLTFLSRLMFFHPREGILSGRLGTTGESLTITSGLSHDEGVCNFSYGFPQTAPIVVTRVQQ